MDTLVSQITAKLKSAVAVIRMSGDESKRIIDSVFSRCIEEPWKVYYGNIQNGDKVIDEVMVTYFKAPKSYTGEDVVEISCHGSQLIVAQIIALLISLGARQAERGEFTSRAFYNGKMDLVQAEAVSSLIDSRTEEQKELSLYALKGKASSTLYPARDLLADILANIEVNIDYPEYKDIEEIGREKIIKGASQVLKEVENLIKDASKANLYMEGISVALVGKPNVGKSSLLNALLGEDKAIVTDIPGTTRDLVEGDINIDGLLLHIIDTAGIRESDNSIEIIGVEKSKQMIQDADLVIHVLDASKPLDEEDKELTKIIGEKKHFTVYNKLDLITSLDKDKIYISAEHKDIKQLVQALKKEYDLEASIKPSLCSSRELGLLIEAKDNLKTALEEAIDLPLDLVSISLKTAYDDLKRILGEEVNLDMEQEVFSRFCVGK